MNKYLIVALLSLAFNANAFNSLNLDKQIVTCQGESGNTYTLNSNSSAEDIIKNCKITHEESGNYALRKETTVEFNATVVTPVKCDYHNNVLDECKFVK